MTMSRSRCISPHERIDQVINQVETLIVDGATYTAGAAIDATQLASLVIAVKFDGTTISLNGDGELQASAASDLAAGCGISIAGGEVSVAHDASLDCVGGLLTVVDNPQDAFTSVVVAGQTTVTANSPTTALTLAAGANIALTTNNATKSITITAAGADGVGYDEIQNEGTPVTKRSKLNLIGDLVTAVDDAGNSRTNVTISAPLQTAIITASIAAASWNSVTKKLTPAKDTAKTFEWVDAGGGAYEYNAGTPVVVSNFFTSAISVGSGKGKIAQTFNGRIISVDCNEITL